MNTHNKPANIEHTRNTQIPKTRDLCYCDTLPPHISTIPATASIPELLAAIEIQLARIRHSGLSSDKSVLQCNLEEAEQDVWENARVTPQRVIVLLPTHSSSTCLHYMKDLGRPTAGKGSLLQQCIEISSLPQPEIEIRISDGFHCVSPPEADTHSATAFALEESTISPSPLIRHDRRKRRRGLAPANRVCRTRVGPMRLLTDDECEVHSLLLALHKNDSPDEQSTKMYTQAEIVEILNEKGSRWNQHRVSRTMHKLFRRVLSRTNTSAMKIYRSLCRSGKINQTLTEIEMYAVGERLREYGVEHLAEVIGNKRRDNVSYSA